MLLHFCALQRSWCWFILWYSNANSCGQQSSAVAARPRGALYRLNFFWSDLLLYDGW